jgi:hypothetical protein
MPSVILRFKKLKISVAIIGINVKARKPKIQGDRNIRPFLISRRLNGIIFRTEFNVDTLGSLESCSSIGHSFNNEKQETHWADQLIDRPAQCIF